MLYPNAPTRGDLSRRLGPVFAEQAAIALANDWMRGQRPAREEVCVTPPADAGHSKAYKPTHGGYPDAR